MSRTYLSELTKQLEPLERQSETAKIYLAKRENLKELDINMFLLEYEHTGNLIRELEEKTRIAENQLKEAQNAHSRTKDEYERLEKILEELNERMEALREESRDRAIRKQQLSGEINVLHEQILAGEQNDSHYRSRLLSSSGRYGEKICRPGGSGRAKKQIFRQIYGRSTENLLTSRKKWTISRAVSKNAPRQWKMVRMRSLRSLIPAQTPKVRHSVLMP